MSVDLSRVQWCVDAWGYPQYEGQWMDQAGQVYTFTVYEEATLEPLIAMANWLSKATMAYGPLVPVPCVADAGGGL